MAPEEWPVVRVLSSGQVVLNEEIEFETSEGQRKVVLSSAAPLRDETGALTGAVITGQDISELRRLERVAAERAQELEAVFEAMTDAVCVFDSKRHVMTINAAGRAILPPDVAPDERRETEPGDRRPLLDEEGRPLPEGRSPGARVLHGEVLTGAQAVDVFLPTSKGTLQALSVTGSPLRTAEGTITGSILVMRDVTERRRVEDALRKSEMRLQMALDASSSGTFVWHVADDRVELDAQIVRLFGVPPDASMHLGQVLAKIIHTDDRARYVGAVTQALDPSGTGKLQEDVRMVLEDGTTRWLTIAGQVSFSNEHDEQHHAISLTGTVTDITARKQAEETLRAREDLHSFLLTLGDKMRTLSDPRHILTIACELVGVKLGVSRVAYGEAGPVGEDLLIVENGWTDGTIQELSGRFPFTTFGNQVPEDYSEDSDLTIDDFLADPRFTEPQVRAFLHQYGIRSGDSAMVVKEGHFAGLLLVHSTSVRHWTSEEHALLHEVAERTWAAVERARAEDALRASELALQEANQRKDEFLDIAAHELRTPLTSIMGNVHIARKYFAALLELVRSLDAEPEIRQRQNSLRQRVEQSELLLERTDQQLVRLGRLVNDLTDTSRIRAGKLDLHPEHCDLLAIVQEAVHEQRVAWSKRTIALRVPQRSGVSVTVDRDRIGQVVTNLLTNALKYSRDAADVVVSVRVEDGSVRVAVQDQGPGLSAAEQAHLFEQFYRVPGIQEQSGSHVGLGLGLHISKTIIERHGGSIGVESVKGRGSTFWFSLPLDASSLS
jgi:PAS domain S-box-containing protein